MWISSFNIIIKTLYTHCSVGSIDTNYCIILLLIAFALIFSPHYQVHGWEPVTLQDNLSLRWGRVADMAVYDDQLVRFSHRSLQKTTIYCVLCLLCCVDWSIICADQCQFVVRECQGEPGDVMYAYTVYI